MALIELNDKEISTIWLALVNASLEVTDLLSDEELDALVSKFEVPDDKASE